MKVTLCISFLLLAGPLSAQLSITPGARLVVTGNSLLTFHNADLLNNGILTTGNSRFHFTGNSSSAIMGSQDTRFFELAINKTGNATLRLERPVAIADQIRFTSGLLDLNGFNADLGSTGRLENEDESRHITGTNGGEVICRMMLNAPSAVNPGNLGAVISSLSNLGNVIIKRGHRAPQLNPGPGTGIQRYYVITPENNTGLDAALSFSYLDGELSGLDENMLTLFNTTDGQNWQNQGLNSRNTALNTVTKTGLNSFSAWTLSVSSALLPVRFISFDATCNGNSVALAWITLEQGNSLRFVVEKSADGILWTPVDSIAATGNSNTETSYAYTDRSPLPNGYYRIAERDLAGNIHYSGSIRPGCYPDDLVSVWPNPVRGSLNISITTNNETRVSVRLFDSKGALVKNLTQTLAGGRSLLQLDCSPLASGVYRIVVEWGNGNRIRAVNLLKL